MKTVVLIGVGFDQVPMIDRARELGCCIIGLDANPSAIGGPLCDYFYIGDIKDPDIVEGLISMHRGRHGGQSIDGVICPATELGPSAGKLIDKYHLNGIGEKTAYRMTNKVERRIMLDQLGILQPFWGLPIDNWNRFPCIIKPAMLSAAVGVKRINNLEQLAIEEYDLVEEYLEGDELSVEVLIFNNGNFLYIMADRNYEYKEKYAPYIIENGCDLPSKYNIYDLDNQIWKIINILITKLNLKNCAIKLDLLIKDNIVYVLECPPRLGGGRLSSHMIQMHCGMDWWELALELCLGLEISAKDLSYKYNKPVRQRYIIHENPKSNRDRGADTIEYA